MKVLQVSPTYHPSMEGVAEYLKNISERLAKKYEVTVFTCDSSGKLPQEEVINGVKVKRFKCFAPSNAYYFSPEMALELRKINFDIVHAHNYHALPFFFAQLAAKSRLVVSPYYHGHGHTPFRNFLFNLYKPLGGGVLKKADRIIAISSSEKTALAKDFPRIIKKIEIVPPGYNPQDNPGSESWVKNPKAILSVGRLEEYKGVQEIIQVFPLLEAGFKLNVVGKGDYKNHLVDLVKRLGLNQRVSFYQDLSRQELMKMYTEAGLFILLSKYESYSIVVAEALACGTPCIVANTSALTEWIDQKNCFGIEYPINSQKLASLIRAIAGKKIAPVKLADWDEAVQKIIKIYEG